MEYLINVSYENERITVSARELHEFLGIKSKYADWFKNMLAYGFEENQDYRAFSKNLENGGRSIDHEITIGMAKEVAMIQRTPKGSQVRKYFIECEKVAKDNANTKSKLNLKKGGSLASVNNAVKIMMPLLQNAGCNVQIQLLTARTIYEQAGLSFPFLIKADDEYLECDKIADKLGVCAQSGKPHGKAIAAIVRKLSINEEDYTETWESTSSWQGTVRKYNSKVYEMIKQWLQDNNYPPVITTVNSKGAEVNYKILYRNLHTQGTISPTQPQA